MNEAAKKLETLELIDREGKALPKSIVQRFIDSLSCRVATPAHSDYAELCKGWNVKKKFSPDLSVFPLSSEDVIAAVNFARDNRLPLAVRSGGHSLVGYSTPSSGLLLDFRFMKGIQVDPLLERAYVQPGNNIGDYDAATNRYGLVSPMGEISFTGITGLTLGGGYGLTSRKFGLSCDHVLACDIVTADGKLVHASADSHPDLYWAIRGAGANFGVTVKFQFKLRPLSNLLAGFAFFGIDQGKQLLKFHRDFTKNSPDALTTNCIFCTMPDGTRGIAVTIRYVGDPDQGRKILEPFLKHQKPLMVNLDYISYAESQKGSDVFAPIGRCYEVRSKFIGDYSDELIDLLVEGYAASPSPFALFFIEQGGGAIAKVAKDATAFYPRDFSYDLVLLAAWEKPEQQAANIEWLKNLWKSVQPFMSKQGYINYIGETDEELVKASYGTNYDRLKKIKTTYDPDNLFRVNHNISPQ